MLTAYGLWWVLPMGGVNVKTTSLLIFAVLFWPFCFHLWAMGFFASTLMLITIKGRKNK